MKKLKNLAFLLTASATMSSCATIFSAFGKKTEVSLLQTPGDLQTKIEGTQVEMQSVYVANRGIGDGAISYYTSGIEFPDKRKNYSLELYSPSTGQRAIVDMKSKKYKGYFWLNLITFPIVGHIIDGATKNNRRTEPRYVDVEYALAGKPQKEWRSKSKLKSISVKQLKKTTKVTTR